MAKIKGEFMAVFTGRIGNMVAYNWKGRQCLRAYQPYTKKSATEKQIKNRLIFGETTRLASAMKPAIDIGLKGYARAHKTTITGFFIRRNHFYVTIEDDVANVDYSKLCIADGSLRPVAFGEVREEAPLKLGVNYGDGDGVGGDGGDYVYLYAYSPSAREGRLSLPGSRYGGHVSVAITERMAASEMHLYGFVWDGRRKVSESK